MKFLKLLFLLLNLNLFAQETFSIQGKITNQENQPITNAEIILLDEQENTIHSTETNQSLFEFKNVKSGQYSISIITENNVQNEPIFDLNENKNFIIQLHDNIEINEVIVNAKKQNFKVENGNLIVDIANSNLSKTSNSTELLSKIPSVILGADKESLSIIGKGTPLLYLDNQQVNFATISSLAVEDIKTIEVIRNPTAKYESNGKVVVKITLKNSKKEGLKLTFQEIASFKRKYNNYLNSTLQFRKNKSEFKLNASYNQLNPWEGNGFDYKVKDKNITSDYFIKSQTKRPHFILNASFFQELNEKGDYLTFSVLSYFRKDKGLIDTQTKYSENNQNQSILSLNHNENRRNSVNSFINYYKVLKSIEATLFTGLQYTIYNDGRTYDFYNNVNENGLVYNQSRDQKYRINAFSMRIDFEKDFENDQKLELGGRLTNADAKTNNLTILANSMTEKFQYKFNELNLAAYMQFSKKYENWDYKVGLRTESTDSKGTNLTRNLMDIDKHYIDWFPNTELNYKFDDHNFTIFYKRTIDRPNYSSISSGNLYGSPYVEYAGNFDILPTYTNTYTANYSYKKWALNITYYQSKNPMNYTLVYDDFRNISTFTTVNFEKEKNISIGLDVPFEYKFWSTQISFSLIYNKIIDKSAVLKKSTPYIYLYSNHNFRLGKGFDFMLDGYWLTKRTEGIYIRNSQAIINLGLTKSYKNFDFTIRYNDLFKQMKFSETLSYEKIDSKNRFIVDNQEFSIAVKYNFGRLNKSIYKENKVNEDDKRIR